MELKNKHIAIICNYELLPNRIGGMDYFFSAFQEKCTENNIKVQWFFPNQPHFDHYKNFEIAAPQNGTSLEQFVLNFIKTNKPAYDVVVTHFVEIATSWYQKIKKALPESQLIAVDHNPRPLGGYPLKKRIEKKIKGFLYSRYIDTFVGVSEYTKKELLNDFGTFNKNKTVVIYNGILTEKLQKRKLKNNFPQFLVASHLRYSKGIQDLIIAVSTMPTHLLVSLKIAVYGNGHYADQLQKMVADLQLQSVFSFKGSVPNLYRIYHQYDYMIQPTHMECFSLSILESLAANVPVITTPVGGNMEVVQHEKNGYIFEAKNTLQLQQLLEAICTGEKSIEQDTHTAIAQQFSIEKMVVQHFQLVHTI